MLHAIAKTHSSCVEQPVQQLFIALSAQLGHVLFGGGAKDAFAHSPPPERPTFAQTDDTMPIGVRMNLANLLIKDQSHWCSMLHKDTQNPDACGKNTSTKCLQTKH